MVLDVSLPLYLKDSQAKAHVDRIRDELKDKMGAKSTTFAKREVEEGSSYQTSGDQPLEPRERNY